MLSAILGMFILEFVDFFQLNRVNFKGLSVGSNLPQFTLLRAHPQPLLKVTFPDGQEDVAVLKRYNPIAVGPNEREEDVDQCIFDGYLSEEKDVYVTVTGCPSTGNFDVTFKSIDSTFTVLS